MQRESENGVSNNINHFSCLTGVAESAPKGVVEENCGGDSVEMSIDDCKDEKIDWDRNCEEGQKHTPHHGYSDDVECGKCPALGRVVLGRL